MPVLIETIHRRAIQGVTQPFICTGINNSTYFVKGRNTARECLIYEWICAHLASALGLPIAPYGLVEVDPEFHRYLPTQFQIIGPGICWGSKKVEGVSWLELSTRPEINIEIRRDILMFDHWIKNNDRTDYNPNLIWNSVTKNLSIIDHNNAFDNKLNDDYFFSTHVFREEWPSIALDLERKARYSERFSKALLVLDKVLDLMPKSWLYSDLEETNLIGFDPNNIRAILSEYESDCFWEVNE
ncbi:Uncharacterised protein [BD1-7 clade bacterium]|uniref:HipA-like kinase domain-containing protein n=1 Tax=BD1-7 clade bacterium TaxID=2029982 RepID=A0A5S9PC49_9GAMM|nr:Uncharacterised protein [BD1-7 clade bacterium]CAA0101420.1 Uncharacterised protein [BD1-7 clade bacterium]